MARQASNLKQAAAERAVELVRDGMVLGLGTGSTAAFAVDKLGALWASGELKEIVGVASSERTAAQARALGIPLRSLDEVAQVDLAIDGADEVDANLDLIKGLGGALLREKQIELRSQRFVVVVDDGKLVGRLGTRAPLPVEVDPSSWQAETSWLQDLECNPILRGGQEQPFVTDNDNWILDCHFPTGIETPERLAQLLDQRRHVRAHGLFLGMASDVIVASNEGIRTMRRQ